MELQSGRHYEARPGASQKGGVERIANALGWFSIGLGLAEVLVPDSVARISGIGEKQGRRAILRAAGLREIAAGVGILSQQKPAAWMWGRFAGDILDLATLGVAVGSNNVKMSRTATATAAVVGVTALDLYCAQKLSGVAEPMRVVESIIINISPQEVYSFWRNLENLPKFISHLESVQVTGENRSHWRVKPQGGRRLEWDSEIMLDVPNSLIKWHAVAGDFPHSGTVHFDRATGGRGALVRVEIEHTLPAGAIGQNIAKLIGAEPRRHIRSGLRQLKQILETGSIVKSEASIHPRMHAARPPAEKEWRCISQEE